MNAPFGGQDRHDRAWSHLLERDDFDVGLLQETQEPPAWARDAFPDCVWRPKYADTGRGKRWGCAVISRTLELEPYEPEERFPWLRARAGATAIARVYTNPTWLASVHFTHKPVPPELLVELGFEGIEVTTRNGKIFETNGLPHELHHLFGDDGFLWGGDLNSDERMDDVSGFAGGNRRIREIYREAGAVSVRALFREQPQQTYFRRGALRDELDHVFVDQVTAEHVVSWRVDPEPATTLGLSDHAPLLIDLTRPPVRLRRTGISP